MANYTKPGTRVMLKVFAVEEGVNEIAVESKWKFFGESGKAQLAQGPQAAVLKAIPPVENAHIELRSENHMLLEYRPFMKHIHPRASTMPLEFVVEGNELQYMPSAQEFEPDMESAVQPSHESRQMLYFKTDESSGEIIKGELWYCTNIKAVKGAQLLRCEEVFAKRVEDIPCEFLRIAVRKSDTKCIYPYNSDIPASSMLSSNQSGKHKMAPKKGKMDANALPVTTQM